ncbi:hypothetical protein BD410DRAFT_789276 [Rickenella mellea]|uniref:Ricin B lectin domain-containing protein n=1 Tax=Rickenella mellea TaxID=50990 RepID=A0A4Y7Q3P5_9AGAM|nr:hypothetical protein BD410DRAFT_789276 [Rickenella mellea]
MLFSKYLLAFVCLPAFSLGVAVTPVPKVSGRPLNSGRFTIISSNDPSLRLDLSPANNLVIAVTATPSSSVNQQWSFIATAGPKTFRIQNGIFSAAFLSPAPDASMIEYALAVVHNIPTDLVVSSFSPGSSFFSIMTDGFALTYWPASDSGLPSKLTFQSPGGAFAPFQNWTFVPVESTVLDSEDRGFGAPLQ